MKLIDTHAHLFLEEFDADRPQVVERARQAGVAHIFLPNIDSTTLAPLLDMCEAYPGYCHPLVGLHPTSVDERYEAELDAVRRQLDARTDFVGIGEIGLDFYWDTTYEAQQRRALDAQLQLALAYGLPVVIHCRKAFEALCQVLEPYRHTPLRGILHCFAGTTDEARRILRDFPGFLLGIGGVVTFKKSPLPEVVRTLPPDRVVLETDAPYLAPVPHRGRRNESAYVRDTLLKVADCWGMPPDEVAEQTSANALALFERAGRQPKSIKRY